MAKSKNEREGTEYWYRDLCVRDLSHILLLSCSWPSYQFAWILPIKILLIILNLCHIFDQFSPSLSFVFFFSFFLFRASPTTYGVPRLEVKLELQLLAYAMARATQDPGHVCDLHQSSWKRQIPNPLGRPGINPCSHGYQLDSLPLSHNGNSSFV